MIAAGAGEDKAREAAEEIAAYESRLVKIESDIAIIKEQMATKTWVLTTSLAQTLVLLGGAATLIKLLH